MYIEKSFYTTMSLIKWVISMKLKSQAVQGLGAGIEDLGLNEIGSEEQYCGQYVRVWNWGFENTVKPVYSDPHWEPTNEATLDRWPFKTGMTHYQNYS